VTTIHPFADDAGNATPQKRAEETKSLSLLQRTLPQARWFRNSPTLAASPPREFLNQNHTGFICLLMSL
jgi:hypothetical protein